MGLESSPDNYYRLTYRDPVGESVQKRLDGAIAQITWENGTRIFITLDDLRPLLDNLEYRLSRKGLLWAKGKAPAANEGSKPEPTLQGRNQP